jgi:hypothetical protein
MMCSRWPSVDSGQPTCRARSIQHSPLIGAVATVVLVVVGAGGAVLVLLVLMVVAIIGAAVVGVGCSVVGGRFGLEQATMNAPSAAAVITALIGVLRVASIRVFLGSFECTVGS